MNGRLGIALSASLAAHAALLWAVSVLYSPAAPEPGVALVAVRILDERAVHEPARPPAPPPRPVWTPRAASTPPSRVGAAPHETSRLTPGAPVPALAPRTEAAAPARSSRQVTLSLPTAPAAREHTAPVPAALPIPEEPPGTGRPSVVDEVEHRAPVAPRAEMAEETAPLIPSRLLSFPQRYPPQAKARGEEGTVGLLLEIHVNGTVGRVEVVKSSGYPDLDRAAQVSVKNARFAPATRRGKPVPTTKRMDVTYRLDDPKED